MIIGAIAVPVLLVGGVVVLAAAGAKKATQTCQGRLPLSKKEQRERAQERVREAEEMVSAASAELEQEKRKWFNHVAIDAASRSLVNKRALLREANESMQQLAGAEIETIEVTHPCGSFLQCSW